MRVSMDANVQLPAYEPARSEPLLTNISQEDHQPPPPKDALDFSDTLPPPPAYAPPITRSIATPIRAHDVKPQPGSRRLMLGHPTPSPSTCPSCSSSSSPPGGGYRVRVVEVTDFPAEKRDNYAFVRLSRHGHQFRTSARTPEWARRSRIPFGETFTFHNPPPAGDSAGVRHASIDFDEESKRGCSKIPASWLLVEILEISGVADDGRIGSASVNILEGDNENGSCESCWGVGIASCVVGYMSVMRNHIERVVASISVDPHPGAQLIFDTLKPFSAAIDILVDWKPVRASSRVCVVACPNVVLMRGDPAKGPCTSLSPYSECPYSECMQDNSRMP
ncbi:uncharacterized protein EV422DRAFT_576099 [Fimicolochytrium jonesii]|uniref:uncharacterized protein n=1 Tax=Fimicolochytrium jonesii TaxID=1396493 RepID=UPI0022FF0593|nr:uncharacterized protein EV422DRAFT_576099 [Fimicolochytrium jonesii]KAI8824827.1 hypothetical protein EV422DRAFT_576099 [Fimicolochytrium jonesii]